MTSYIKGKLGDIIELLYGKSLPENKRIYGKYPVMGSGGISGYHNEYLCKGPGIIIGRKGSIGTIQYIKDNYFPIDTVFYVKPKNTTMPIKYIYYLLTQLNLKLLNTDAAVPGLNREVALSQNISYLENEKEQEKIAKILSNYDDLIENNNRRIKILEEMAQKIYKEWFVDFKFPGHETATFKNSELGEIPSNWNIGTIKSINDVVGGYAFKSSDLMDKGQKGVIKIKNIQSGNIDLSSCQFIDDNIAQKANKFLLNSGDMLIAMTGAQVGKVGIMPITKINYYLNQRVGRFVPNKKYIINNQFLFIYTQSEKFINQINNVASGAAQPNISTNQIENIDILLPEEVILSKFEQKIDAIYKECQLLKSKNKNLKQTRDILLPRLISGEIDIENLEIE